MGQRRDLAVGLAHTAVDHRARKAMVHKNSAHSSLLPSAITPAPKVPQPSKTALPAKYQVFKRELMRSMSHSNHGVKGIFSSHWSYGKGALNLAFDVTEIQKFSSYLPMSWFLLFTL